LESSFRSSILVFFLTFWYSCCGDSISLITI
jgi:hypothetical protein